MIRFLQLALATSIALACVAPAAVAGAPTTIPGVAFDGPFDASTPARLQLSGTAPARAITLPPVTAGERTSLTLKASLSDASASRRPAPMQIGIGRDVPAAAGSVDLASLSWQMAADGDRAARIVLQSPQAEALRAELTLTGATDGVTFRFGGNEAEAEVFGPFDWSQMESMSRWTPIVDGDTMTIEVALGAGLSPAGRSLSISRLAHHDVSLNPRSTSALKATGIGASGSCNIDIACVANQSPVAATTGLSTARMSFVMNGNSFVCSGQLINSIDAQGAPTQIPYFLTANHCINTPIAAGTIQFSWFFEATSCRGGSAPNARTTTGGGALLYTSESVDVTLLRLNAPPPAGVFLAGWDATPAMPGTSIVSLHHPSGDLTKFSAGTLASYGHFCDRVDRNGACTLSQGSYLRVNWAQGTTEGGSSGSGVYTVDATGSYRLRGVLHGGGASCETPSDPDYFSRFDLAYPALSETLAGIPQAQAGTNAIEFYNVDLDHYFLTSFADETTAIESGSAGRGWVRTGYSFPVGAGLKAGEVPVCRFYGPGPNSHFYTAEAAECAQVKRDPGWIYEATAFNIVVPAGKSCSANTSPIYRTYNNGFVNNNSNHRYTTSPYIYQWMQAQPSVMSIFLGRKEGVTRWSGEATVMCAPAA